CDEVNEPPLELLKWIRTLNRFTQLADDSDEVPKLQGGKSYMGFRLSPQEWKDLELMYDVLQVRYFSLTITSIEAGVNNLQKWYHKTDDTSVYFICLALDPNYKVAYAKVKWDPDHFDEGMTRFNKVVCRSSFH
ncbi:hypothetical protein CY34DRAFT_102284, partial [Suillus luteus UH-Slu-Lm8-n1]